jgi:hypothetical protein
MDHGGTTVPSHRLDRSALAGDGGTHAKCNGYIRG